MSDLERPSRQESLRLLAEVACHLDAQWLRAIMEAERYERPALYVSVPGATWARVVAGAVWFWWEHLEPRRIIDRIDRPEFAALTIMETLDMLRQERQKPDMPRRAR